MAAQDARKRTEPKDHLGGSHTPHVSSLRVEYELSHRSWILRENMEKHDGDQKKKRK